MLLRFAVTNHQSIRSRQELSLVGSSLTDEGVDLLHSPVIRERVLPAVMIYGANASGKSALLRALRLMCGHIRSSQIEGRPGQGVPRSPFLLDAESATNPSEFECDFIVDDVRYYFSYAFDSQRVINEVLYAIGSGGRRLLYERDGASYSFGKALRGQNKAISNFTRSDSLFISAAAQNAHPQLTPIYSFFSEKILFEMSTALADPIIARKYKGKIDPRVKNFLVNADAGITDMMVEEVAMDDNAKAMVDGLASVLREHLPDAPKNLELMPELLRIRLAHAGTLPKPVYIDLNFESRGTLRILELLAPAFACLDGGGVLVVDELDSSLHTLIAREFIALFTRRSTNPFGAQLVATTHDTNTLAGGLLRRDQVWLTEKSADGETHLYPLTDIKTRKTDNIQRGYLQGRFGAVPIIGDVFDRVVEGEAE